MPTSVYFNNQNASREQFLLEDMIIESIRNHGIDVYYIPRTSQSILDSLFGDDPVKYFDTAYKVDMYLETFNDFQGQQEFFSKFGLQIEKTARMAIARRTFERYVPKRSLPYEGDLVYLPVQRKLMEVRFVEREASFFQLGKVVPYMYVLSMETFKYNGEFLNTGIEEIDHIVDDECPSIDFILVDGGQTLSYTRGEVVYQGTDIANSTCKGIVTMFNRPTNTLRVRNIKGTFEPGENIIGLQTGANFELASYVGMENPINTFEDNVLLETEGGQVLDFSESNPFGNPY